MRIPALVLTLLVSSACTSGMHLAAPGSPTPTPTTNARAAQDCGRLHFGVDGTFGPVVCPNRHPNQRALELYRSQGALTVDLGPGQIQRALCADLTDSTIPMVQDEYTLAVARFGWDLPLDPSSDDALINCKP
jgi:hypothetical protein